MCLFVLTLYFLGLAWASPQYEPQAHDEGKIKRFALDSESLASSTTSTSAPAATSTQPTWARTSPPSGAIIIDSSSPPTPSSYPTIQEGINALSPNITTPQYVFIYAGIYAEQVLIPALYSNLTIQGYTPDNRHYTNNSVTITSSLSSLGLDASSDDLSATVRNWNPNTKFYNLNINNNFSSTSPSIKAPALSAQVSGQGYYAIQFSSPTSGGPILSQTGHQLYGKCLIIGSHDLIYGLNATAWFDTVDIRTSGSGSIVLSQRNASSDPSSYVINHSNIDKWNSSEPDGENYLGGGGGEWARVVVQTTYLGANINAKGWDTQNGSMANVEFAEYENSGPGSISEDGSRVNGSVQLDEPSTVQSVLGWWYDEWWVDSDYFGSVGNP